MEECIVVEWRGRGGRGDAHFVCMFVCVMDGWMNVLVLLSSWSKAFKSV